MRTAYFTWLASGTNTQYTIRSKKTMHATICDMITDLVQNAIEADATEIKLTVEETENRLEVRLEDNGKGMDAATLEKAKDPFFTDGQKHVHRKVGLGLPFLFQTAEATGGQANIESEKGVGTVVAFELDKKNVDLPVFGNFAQTAVALMAYGFGGNLKIERRVNQKRYAGDKNELIEVLGGLDDPDGLVLLRAFFEANEEDICE